MFLKDLEQAASNQCKLKHDLPILLGVSGGADSLALMFGFASLGYKPVIAHLDHGLRPESGMEAEFVKQLATSRGWYFSSQKINVNEFAESERLSIEEAAREVRYRFLFEQARLHGCQAVAVGHHADDQVETILMHFLRGTALSGLKGMPFRRIMPQWDMQIPLVRPMLEIWREDINAYINSLGLTPVFDHSNLDTTYYRNRLRQRLIPELITYNPQFKSVILRMANVLNEEAAWMDILSAQSYLDCISKETDERIEIYLARFLMLSKALKRRVLRLAIEKLRPDLRDIGFNAINRGLNFVDKASSGEQIDLIARLNLAVVHDLLIIKTWTARLPDFELPLVMEQSFVGSLEIDKRINLRNRWSLEATLPTEMPADLLKAVKHISINEAWLDFDKVAMPLTVRGPRAGERFQPLGMAGHSQSLQDLFVNQKVPGHLRPFWPLIVSEENIAWVVGLRPSEVFKITNNTQRILKIQLIKES